MLKCVAVCCSSLQRQLATDARRPSGAVVASVVCVAADSSVLQYVTVYVAVCVAAGCIVLQYVFTVRCALTTCN